MGSNLIRDGYTMQGFIAPMPGLHCGMSFEFRPMLSREVYALDGRLQKATLEQRHAMLAAMLAKQLVSWSEEQPDGQPWPINEATVSCLPFTLFHRLTDIVRMLAASDLVPETSGEHGELERLLEGESPEATLRGN